METPSSYRLFTVAALMLLLCAGHLQLTSAAQIKCDPVQISWCLQSIVSNRPPTAECCQKLKKQEPCLCHETADPTFGGYLGLPGAVTVCNACNVTFPYCN